MKWTDLLQSEIEATYKATEGLLELVDEDKLDWKPGDGSNWMTTGQLLEHITTACGMCCKGFVADGWGKPAETEETPTADMLPPAEELPAAKSMADVRRKLAEDKKLAQKMVVEAGEDRLANEQIKAPWDPMDMALGQRLLHMVGHLGQHKAQLFYYLKLQGKPVNTAHLWGM